MRLKGWCGRNADGVSAIVMIFAIFLYSSWPSHSKEYVSHGSWGYRTENGDCRLRYEDWSNILFAYSLRYDGTSFKVIVQKGIANFSDSWRDLFGIQHPTAFTFNSGAIQKKIWMHYSDVYEGLVLSATANDEDGGRVGRGDIVKLLYFQKYGATITLKHKGTILATFKTDGLEEALYHFQQCLSKG